MTNETDLSLLSVQEIEALENKKRTELDACYNAIAEVQNALHANRKELIEIDFQKKQKEMARQDMLQSRDKARTSKDKLLNDLQLLKSVYWQRRHQ